MKRFRIPRKLISIFICLALLASYLPATLSAASMAASTITGSVTDPGTADAWESMMGTDIDGNRYAGRVWVDKSVYTNGQTVTLNSRGEYNSSFKVSLEDDEFFQIIFSALGSSMTTTTKTSTTGPVDVVLILDTSTSMDDTSGGVTRLQRVIEEANKLIEDLLTIKNVRIAIVTYNYDSETVIPLDFYTNGLKLVVNNYFNNNKADAGVVYAYDNENKILGKDSGYTTGTNLQAGIDRGFNILANADNVEGRVPVAVVLTDGQSNRAERDDWYTLEGTGSGYISDERMVLSTMLNAAYNKAKVEEKYGREQRVYSISVDLPANSEAHALMNPGALVNGFNSGNSHDSISEAYEKYLQWAEGDTVTITAGGGWYGGGEQWRFDHNYPTLGGAITDQDIINNINYVSPNSFYDVTSTESSGGSGVADLSDAFEQIYQELSSGVFNPITDSSTVDGSIGVDNTPLIYVDYIGRYMEIKEITHVTVFGASYGVVNNGDGTYTVAAATGTNPTTNENWNTSSDIRITITEQSDGTQKLEIRINQEILPIIMEQVLSNTVGEETSATITEFVYDPLRVYYTVGIDQDILLPNGKIDVTKIQGYEYVDDSTGTVALYGGQFGEENPADSNGIVQIGDAHVGFKPSIDNRYYFHKANQGVFSAVASKDNRPIEWDASEYGVLYEAGKFDLTYLTYEEYLTIEDDEQVYTYVKYYRPTESQTDAASAAEEVTYLVYTDWGYLKESIAFYDRNAGVFINYDATNGFSTGDIGYVVEPEHAGATVEAYLAANPGADIKAMLAVDSLRTSRLHNMSEEKSSNVTETAVVSYKPEYTLDEAGDHYDNDVVIWLGNNGRLTVAIDTGIALTKNVTEAIGNADDTYELTVTVPAGVVADPVVMDSKGNDVTAALSTYADNVLTVNVKAGETVYVSGIPGGTVCTIGENIPAEADYFIASKTDTVTVPMVSQVLDDTATVAQYAPAYVTNAPNKYGNLFITKEISSQHNIPADILEKDFEITVNVGAELSSEIVTVKKTGQADTTAVVDVAGNMVFTIRAGQTIELIGLPAGTNATITETDPGANFSITYRTRNHSGENADADNAVVIPADGNATAVIINDYTPLSTTVDMDVRITKNFTMEGSHSGGSFTFKVQSWNGTEWIDVPGKSAVTVYEADTSGTKVVDIEDVLDGVLFTEVGSWAYQILEVKGAVENVTYDRTLYTFTVKVTDNNGQLTATITDVNNEIIDDGIYEVTFNNTYHTAPVSIDIIKTVENNSGDSSVSKAGFDFTAIRTDANWVPLTGADASQMSVYTDAAGEARFTATYKAAGTYYYVITEVDENVPGWTYSDAAYLVTVVVVEDNGDLVATLSIEKTGSDNPDEIAQVDAADATKGYIYFINTYDPEDVTVDLDGKVVKELTGKDLEADMFTFYVCADGTDNPILIGKNELNGDVKFVDFAGELKFDKIGTYLYDITEMIPDGAVYDSISGKYVLNGMHYDPTIYDLVVEVKNDLNTGKLVVTCYFEDSVTDTVTFRNRYVVTSDSYRIGGQKLLNGRALNAGEFTFELYQGDTLLETVTNKGDGSFLFTSIVYDAAGTYTYTIREAAGSLAGVTYDGANNPVTVTVSVVDTDGVLTATADKDNVEIVFENTYTATPAEVVFEGTKTLKGAELADDSFTFRLYSTDSSFDIKAASAQLVASAKNVGGAFTLATEKFATPGNYFYVIVEDATENPVENVVYDSTVYRIRVRVRDVGDGQLRVAVTNMDTDVTSQSAASATVTATFTNATFEEVVEKEVYLAGQTTTIIDGSRVNVGDILTYFITYINYTGEDVVVDIKDTIPQYTSYVDGSASHGGTYAAAYISWTLNVPKDEYVTVSFDVRVDEPDAIVANTAVVRDGVNTYTTNEVVNHTIENELKKDVFTPADLTVSVDGKKVYAGDELVYEITFTNSSADTADIEITDIIPANTTYVDGSASEGGVYDNGKILWDIDNISAWSTVKVSFKVTVNADVGAVIIENRATATDGTNEYETDVITNYTVEDEVGKEVFSESDPSINIDGRTVLVGDVLVYAISYTNTSKESANVTIVDTIPQYTSYVIGSADNAGIFENEKITWNLEVAPEQTVTVTFKVRVEDGGANAPIANKAQVLEGRNTYTTNEIINPSDTPVPPNPPTSDENNLWKWITLLFISGTGLTGIKKYKKNRADAENA